MLKKLYPVFFTALFLASCISSHVNMKRLDQSAFPPDFNNPKYVLLLQKRTEGLNHGGMNRYLSKYFRKYYGGKWEMASIEDINANPKYKDKEVYRYILTDEVWRSNSTVTTTSSTGTSIQYNNAYRLGYHLYDRKSEQALPDFGLDSNVPAKAMKKVANALGQRLKADANLQASK